MSLELAAQHLAAQGRGPDKQLVHMSPREVAGLQALAMAQGGSLTINPETGLPEAGFLDNILPAVIGAGLMFATGGASAAAMPGLFGLGMPATIGLGVGALQTARTGSLEKGLMAGLGAYGGAGMLGSVMGAGTGALSASAAPAQTAIPTPAMPVVPEAAGAAFTVPPPPEVYANPFTGQPNLADYAYGPDIQSSLLDQQARNQSLANLSERFEGLRIDPLTESQNPRLSSIRSLGGPEAINALYGQSPPPLTISAPTAVPVASPAAITPAPMMDPNIVSEATQERLLADRLASATPAEKAKAGLRAIADKPSMLFTKDNLKYGLAATAPALLAQPKYKAPELDREQYRYAYSPGRVANPEEKYMGALTGERTYFQPTFTRLAEGGGVMDRARRSILGDKPEQSDNQYKYTYDPAKQQYTKVIPPAVPLAALAEAMPFVDTGGYGGGEMGGGPGLAGLSAAALGESHGDAAIGAFDAASQSAADAAAGAAGAAAGAAAGQGLGYGGVGASAGDGDGSGGFYARGGSISHLGDYSDGGRLLKGPGDGVSDSIPAMIGRKQPARLADGEFVVPARIVSELGNGSTDAGARKLYAMMDRIQKARGKTVGKGKVAKNSRAEKYLPA